MKSNFLAGVGLIAAFALAGCVTPYVESPDTVIAVGADTGWDDRRIPDGRAAIAYDPDGCQNWLIDDGVEGYASPRFDPATGMANVCDNRFPPGAVIGNHQTPNAGLRDWVPSSSRVARYRERCDEQGNCR